MAAFDASAYNNLGLMSQLINQQQARQDNINAQNNQILSQGLQSAADTVKYNQFNDLLAQNTDENGNLNQQSLLAQLQQQDPQKAMALKQQFASQAAEAEKNIAQIQKVKAETLKAQSEAQVKNIQSHLDGANYLAQMVGNASSQSEMDNILKIANNAGIDVSQFQGQTFTPELKQKALQQTLSYKDMIENDLKKAQLQVSQQNANATTLNARTNAMKSVNDIQQSGDELAIKQQNANATTQNANTNAGRLQADQAKNANQAIANKQKSYAQDVQTFGKAKADYLEQRNNIGSEVSYINNSISSLQQARDMLASNPNLAGNAWAKAGNRLANAFGSNNEYSNFTAKLNQGVSAEVLRIMGTQKGPQTDKDAERIRDSVLPNASISDPKILISSIDRLINDMNNAKTGKQKQLNSGLSTLKQLQSSFTQKYGASGGQDTSGTAPAQTMEQPQQ